MEVSPDVRRWLFDPDTHVDALRIASARNLQASSYLSAFAFADRLCRLTGWRDTDGLLLRSEALRGLNEPVAAAKDVAKAYKIDPLEPLVAVRYLKAGSAGDQKRRLIRDILLGPRLRRSVAHEALEVASTIGVEIISHLRQEAGAFVGWVAWQGASRIPLELAVTDHHSRQIADLRLLRLRRDDRHPFTSDQWHASDFVVQAQPSETGEGRRATLRTVGEIGEHLVLKANSGREPTPQIVVPSLAARPAGVTVVVPLYGDLPSARRCLKSLARQRLSGVPLRTILVQDNPGDEALTRLARQFAEQLPARLIVNPTNLGFAASVNRALSCSERDEILLLNSDVCLPENAVERMRLVAASTGGTVTPMSNNGEETSFPSPFRPGRIGTLHKIRRLDAAAARVNTERVVTLVNGVGFCLFITRACIDAIGALPESYERGYYEDVDFCLRARAAGFPNVCATNVYVGHKGTTSFRGDKRALVVRNQRILMQRFPTYETESTALVKADPLRKARAAIELDAGPDKRHATLLIVRERDLDKARGYLNRRHRSRTIAAIWRTNRPGLVSIEALDGSNPSSLEFDTNDQALVDYVTVRAGIRHVVVFEAHSGATATVEALQRAGCLIDLLLEDGCIRRVEQPCRSCDEGQSSPCAPCREHKTEPADEAKALIALANRLQPTNAMAASLLDLPKEPVAAETANRMSKTSQDQRIGILLPNPDAAAERFLGRLCEAASMSRSRCSFIILGAAIDDLRLMARCFVTGPVAWQEARKLIRFHQIGRMLAPHRFSGYGALQRMAAGLPFAYFDWSNGSAPRKDGDLALDYRICDAKAARLILAWCEAPARAAA